MMSTNHKESADYKDPDYSSHDPRDHEVDPEEVNKSSLWAMYAVFTTSAIPSNITVDSVNAQLERVDVQTRGWYDVAGFRADADLMIWWVSNDAKSLQEAYHTLLNSDFGAYLEPVWSAVATHRPSEFNQQHLPSCFGGVAPREWLAVYPFVRSYEWYLLDPKERAEMLREHGIQGTKYPDVKASTLASFALSDYEWILALEADAPVRLVDTMYAMRYVKARRHVREEIPFFTGQRVTPEKWLSRQTRV